MGTENCKHGTCVEARVVAAGEGDHDLPLVLHYLVVGNRVLPQDVWGDQAHLVPAIKKNSLISLKGLSHEMDLAFEDMHGQF
jgi:hypothetical protein